MVTRPFGVASTDVRQLSGEFRNLRPSVVGNILPVLGLSAGLAILSGGMLDATAGGLALSSAGYGLTTSLYGLQDILARLLIPVVEGVTPILSSVIDQVVEWDEATDGLSTKLIAGAGAAYLFRNQLSSLFRLAASAPGLAGGVSGLGNVAGIGADELADRLGIPRSLITGTSLGAGGPIAAPPIPIDEILEGIGTFNPRVQDQVTQFLQRFGLAQVEEREGPLPTEGGFILDDFLRSLGQYQEPAPAQPTSAVPQFQPAPLQPVAAAPQTTNHNTFYISSYDDNELLRKLQQFIDQGALVPT